LFVLLLFLFQFQLLQLQFAASCSAASHSLAHYWLKKGAHRPTQSQQAKLALRKPKGGNSKGFLATFLAKKLSLSPPELFLQFVWRSNSSPGQQEATSNKQQCCKGRPFALVHQTNELATVP